MLTCIAICITKRYSLRMEENLKDFILEWDDQKNAINIQKHGLSFETAKYVFADDCRIEIYDEKHSSQEERYITLGMVGSVLFVVYTVRGAHYRLISARRANARERSIYYGED